MTRDQYDFDVDEEDKYFLSPRHAKDPLPTHTPHVPKYLIPCEVSLMEVVLQDPRVQIKICDFGESFVYDASGG
ncbi:hypothetical protein EUX98_g8807 [Antrodiella citrinella]|uniref:Protein kinase domain-containing protein n=1 Tax=Antrodiella citrinella TaxID=2447956 RepID=A0A4S4M4C7_9APHY|nr:hypothetical protein EUX98_g8807 [Antrodiella citrinella]